MAVVSCEREEETGIIGLGIIDGQAEGNYVKYYDRSDDRLEPIRWEGGPQGCVGECRPRLVEFTQCNKVLVRDVRRSALLLHQ